jgi:hypothetical protein
MANSETMDIADACVVFRETVRYEPTKKRAIARHMVKSLAALVIELEALEAVEETLGVGTCALNCHTQCKAELHGMPSECRNLNMRNQLRGDGT